MNKKTLYGAQAREAILEGVKKISAAVKCTLGPMGRNVLISEGQVVDYGFRSYPVHVTKDGYTVARAFDLEDPLQKPGVLMIKEAAQRSVDQAGDGTTTTVVLAEAIVIEALKRIDEGQNPMALKKEIDREVALVVNELKCIAVPIKGDIEKIRQIATVSANNDPAIGDMIADAFKIIGDEGMIDVDKGISNFTEIKVAAGYRVASGWESPFFVTDRNKMICEFEDPLILLYDKVIKHHSQMLRALELAHQAGKPLLIICEGADNEGLGFLVTNVLQKRVACCLVQAPAFGAARIEEMEDLAILTGGTYISDLRGVSAKDVELENFGRAKKVIISKEETMIIGADSGPEVTHLLNELRMNLTQAKNEEERYPIEKRIARLTSGVAVILVGANTDVERREKMDRFDDSIRATKSAIEEGFVIGGGAALLRLRTGNSIMDAALSEPFKQICRNAGVDYTPILENLEKTIYAGPTMGYNAKTDKIEDMILSGIIDPAKVLRCALENAASSAGMIITSECVIADSF